MQTNRPMPSFSVNLLDYYNSTMRTEEGLVIVSGATVCPVLAACMWIARGYCSGRQSSSACGGVRPAAAGRLASLAGCSLQPALLQGSSNDANALRMLLFCSPC